jgi:hypothetical protein
MPTSAGGESSCWHRGMGTRGVIGDYSLGSHWGLDASLRSQPATAAALSSKLKLSRSSKSLLDCG